MEGPQIEVKLNYRNSMTRSSGGRTTLYVESVSGPIPRPSVLKKNLVSKTQIHIKLPDPWGMC